MAGLPDHKFINPEVFSDTVISKVKEESRFKNIASVNTELLGVAGSTLSFQIQGYIGDAVEFVRGDDIELSEMEDTVKSVEVKQVGKATRIFDVDQSGLNVKQERIVNNIATAVTNKIDSDCFNTLSGATLKLDASATTHLTKDAISDALVLFGEDLDGPKYLYISAEQASQLRHDPNFITLSGMAEVSTASGVIGSIWGCEVIITNRVKAKTKKVVNFIVKPEAVTISVKNDVSVEDQRESIKRATLYSAAAEYVAYLSDESKVIALTVSENPVVTP